MEISCTLGGQYLILPYAMLFDMYPHATRKESIGYSAYFMALDVSVPERSILSGLCIRKDGRLYTARINLDDYYENAKGVFKSVTSAGRFSRSARDIKLSEISEAGGVPLQADLSYDGVWYPAEVDLSICIVNKGEGFMYDQQYVTFCEYSLLTLTYHFTYSDRPFDRDGALTKFFEGFPLVGFIVAAVHSLTGNEVRELRLHVDHCQKLKFLPFCRNGR